jgi:hypothetical protein
MTTSARNMARGRRAYIPTTTLAKSLAFAEDSMHVTLTDGRILSVPLAWFPALNSATPEQREKYRIDAGGRGLHSPEIDEALSVAGLLAGADSQSP